jgi:sugar/nucleoside kinase (ribokinase family)
MPRATEEHQPTALVVGVISLDVIYHADSERVTIRFGGVSHNIAVTLAALDIQATFVSPSYTGEIGEAVPAHLARAGVDWRPLDAVAPLAHFSAEVGRDGSLGRHRFVDNDAFGPLTAAALGDSTLALPSACRAIVTCTDLSLDGLQALRDLARLRALQFWLVASDVTTAPKMLELRPLPDVVCLNSDELQRVSGALDESSSLARAAGGLVGGLGVAVVTLGEQGALMVDAANSTYWRQTQGASLTGSTLGAGDVLAAAMLAGRLHGLPWPKSLSDATARAEQFVAAGGAGTTLVEQLKPSCSSGPPPQAYGL